MLTNQTAHVYVIMLQEIMCSKKQVLLGAYNFIKFFSDKFIVTSKMETKEAISY